MHLTAQVMEHFTVELLHISLIGNRHTGARPNCCSSLNFSYLNDSLHAEVLTSSFVGGTTAPHTVQHRGTPLAFVNGELVVNN